MFFYNIFHIFQRNTKHFTAIHFISLKYLINNIKNNKNNE